MSLELPGETIVSAPQVPTLVMAPPVTSIAVVPVQGSVGPQGPPGDTAQTLAFVHTQTQPATLVQIIHNLAFNPSGIVCLESGGSPPLIGVSVSYPTLGIIELSFGAPFTGTIYLS
jgi:hypothetical protein